MIPIPNSGPGLGILPGAVLLAAALGIFSPALADPEDLEAETGKPAPSDTLAAPDSAAVRGFDPNQPPPYRVALGLSAGFPQIVALTAEYAFHPLLRAQVSAGTLVIVSSGCARVIAIPEWLKVQPYAFLGGGGVYVIPIDGGEEGFSPFSWWGFGVRFKVKRVRLFVEVGEVGNLKQSHGYDNSYTSAAAGFLVTL